MKIDGKHRRVAEEKLSTTPGKSIAKSSVKSLFYHDVPPELIRRIALRYTEGHQKYGVSHTNLNWRIGLNDSEYVADRINHMFQHMLNFLSDGDVLDDNLGAIAWSVGFLCEVERLSPSTLEEVLGQCKLYGTEAQKYKEVIEERYGETT